MSLREAIARIASAARTRVGPATQLSGPKGNEIISTPPDELAIASGLPLSLYALARAVESEEGRSEAPVLLAVAEIVRNRAAQRRVPVSQIILFDPEESQSGKFGRQSRGRFVASTLDPTHRSLEAARIALEEGSNIAAGATKFFSPRGQDGGSQAGKPLKQDAVGIVKKWGGEGFKWIAEAPLYREFLADPYRFMILGTQAVGKHLLASVEEAISAIHRGRGGSPPKNRAPVV